MTVPERIAALVVGGTTPEALRRCVESVATTPHATWCAVRTPDEAEAVRGLAMVRRYDPWPGRTGALARLHGDANIGEGPVAILASETVVARGFLTRAGRLLRRGAAVVVSAPERGRAGGPWKPRGSITLRMLSDATLRPGSGMVLRGDAMTAVVRRGWLEGQELSVAEVRRIAGPVRVLRRAIRRPPTEPATSGGRLSVTVLIPAFNEEGWIGATLRSIRAQTRTPDEVLVVDDASTDRTADVARHYGATVLQASGSRSKAGAQNLGLERVTTDVVVMLDADTILDPEAVEHLVADLERGNDATTGAVLPQTFRGVWSRGRMVEYALALRLFKRAQRFLGSVVVISGCIAAFRTEALRELGGFAQRTVTEDLDITWRLHLMGYRIGYATRALGYPAEPPSWRLFKAQMRRWAGGFFQAVAAHRRNLRSRPALAFIVLAAVWDVLAVAIMLGVLATLIATGGVEVGWPLFLLWQGIILGIPLVMASTVVGVRRAVTSMPAYALVVYVGQYFYLEAFVREILLRQRRMRWIKGH